MECDRHRAATTGSTGMIAVLLKPPEGAPKTRLNTADRIGTESILLWLVTAGLTPVWYREYPTAPCDGVCPRRSRYHAHRSGGGS